MLEPLQKLAGLESSKVDVNPTDVQSKTKYHPKTFILIEIKFRCD